MGTRWIRMLSNLRRRLGFELVRPWRSEERLHIPVHFVRTDTGQRLENWAFIDRDSGDVVPLLGGRDWIQRGVREDHRPRSVDGTFTQLGPIKGIVVGESDASYTVTFDSAARYSDCE